MSLAFSNYQPSHVQYFNANETSELDAVILDPHGYDGFNGHSDGTEFFETFKGFQEICLLNREQLKKLCKSEADRFAPEISQRQAEILSACGYRIALVQILLPRELIDANRTEDRAIKWLFDHHQHLEWSEHFTKLYQQAIAEEEKVLKQLAPHGKFMAVHSMRGYNINPDYEYMMEPPQKLQSAEQWKEYYERKIEFMGSPQMQIPNREHCLLTKLNNEIIADEELRDSVIQRFKGANITHAIDDPYYYESWIKESGLLLKHSGISVDVVKEKLCANAEKNPKLYNLIPDLEKIEEMATELAYAMSYAIDQHQTN